MSGMTVCCQRGVSPRSVDEKTIHLAQSLIAFAGELWYSRLSYDYRWLTGTRLSAQLRHHRIIRIILHKRKSHISEAIACNVYPLLHRSIIWS